CITPESALFPYTTLFRSTSSVSASWTTTGISPLVSNFRSDSSMLSSILGSLRCGTGRPRADLRLPRRHARCPQELLDAGDARLLVVQHAGHQHRVDAAVHEAVQQMLQRPR